MRTPMRTMMAAMALLSVGACLEWKQPTDADRITVSRYVALVQTLDGSRIAVEQTGAPPAAGSGGTISAPVPSLVLLGGTVQVPVTSATPFTKIIVAVPGVPDYYELTLAAPSTDTKILIVFSQDAPKLTFDLQLGGGGAYSTAPVSLIPVGTGEVQVNVTWNSKADVDLHVLDPSFNEIYYARRTGTSGGTLDLDSNAACGSDGPRAENVFWPKGIQAPRGEYIVRVDYWSSCGVTSTDYVVTINVKGRPSRTYTGTLTGGGTGGGAGAGTEVARVTY